MCPAIHEPLLRSPTFLGCQRLRRSASLTHRFVSTNCNCCCPRRVPAFLPLPPPSPKACSRFFLGFSRDIFPFVAREIRGGGLVFAFVFRPLLQKAPPGPKTKNPKTASEEQQGDGGNGGPSGRHSCIPVFCNSLQLQRFELVSCRGKTKLMAKPLRRIYFCDGPGARRGILAGASGSPGFFFFPGFFRQRIRRHGQPDCRCRVTSTPSRKSDPTFNVRGPSPTQGITKRSGLWVYTKDRSGPARLQNQPP